MNTINSYVFEGKWVLLGDAYPHNLDRVMLTDGDSIVIGSVSIQDNTLTWLFDRSDIKDYKPIAWMDLPLISVIKKQTA